MCPQVIGAVERIKSIVVGVVCVLALHPASGNDETQTDALCKNTSQRLQAAELEGFGIRFRAEPAGDVQRITLNVQSSICIQTSGSGCGTTTFKFDDARLIVGDSTSALETSQPNEYRYTARFELAGSRMNDAELRLIYEGDRCAVDGRGLHTFIVDLRDAVENAPDFFF